MSEEQNRSKAGTPSPRAIVWVNIGTPTGPEQRAATTGAEKRQAEKLNFSKSYAFAPYVLPKSAQGEMVPWQPSQGEMPAEAWYV